MKDGYKLELQTPKAMKLFGNTHKKNDRESKKRRKCAKCWSRWSSFSPM